VRIGIVGRMLIPCGLPPSVGASAVAVAKRMHMSVCLMCGSSLAFCYKDEKKRIVPIIHASDGCHAILPSSMPSTHGSAGNQGHGGLELLTAEVIRLREELKDCKQRLLVPYGL